MYVYTIDRTYVCLSLHLSVSLSVRLSIRWYICVYFPKLMCVHEHNDEWQVKRSFTNH